MQSIAFDPLTEKLYGITEDSTFYEIDVATANSTRIGPVGFGEILGLGFDLTGTLYATADTSDELITIDTTTGAGAAVGDTIDSITSIAVRPEDGVMFAIETIGDTVQTLDLTNGDATLVGAYDANVRFMVGLAFSPVPEPSAFVLMVIGLLTALRRRRRLLFPT